MRISSITYFCPYKISFKRGKRKQRQEMKETCREEKENRQMGCKSIQNIKARERLTCSGKEDKCVREAGTENKTENRYTGKKREGKGDYPEHGVIDLRREIG